jgi:hypothetical protein
MAEGSKNLNGIQGRLSPYSWYTLRVREGSLSIHKPPLTLQVNVCFFLLYPFCNLDERGFVGFHLAILIKVIVVHNGLHGPVFFSETPEFDDAAHPHFLVVEPCVHKPCGFIDNVRVKLVLIGKLVWRFRVLTGIMPATPFFLVAPATST